MATKSRKYRRRSCKHGKLKTPAKTKNGGKRMCKKKRSRSSKKCKYGKLKTPSKTKNGGKRMCKRKRSYKMGCKKKNKSRSSYSMDNGPGENYEQDYVRSASQITSRTRSGGIVGTILSIPASIVELVSSLLQVGVTKEELEDINRLSPEELNDILNNQQR